MQIVFRKISELTLDPNNANTHPDDNLAAINGSLTKFKQQKPIVIDKSGLIVAGNGTVLAAQKLGWTDIACVVTELEGADKLAFALADNRTSELSIWNTQALSDSLKELLAVDFDIEAIGFDKDFLIEAPFVGESDPDDVPENVETRCKPGDLWILGEHRLLCGDSTNVQHVERLMDGAKADMVFTDPPYGMRYGGGRKFGMIEGDDQDPTPFYAVLGFAKETYIWGRVENWEHLPAKPPRDVIVWKKNNFGLGRGYRGQYEVCFYYGDFSGSDSDVWEVPKDTDYAHPTQKPVALCERAIKNSNPKTVLDFYLGSGSTLIACEKTNRKCYGCEIDPKYCDVVISRWEKFSGKKAVLDGQA